MRIGVIGDYTPVFESHPATTDAILLAAKSARLDVTVEWLPTTDVSDRALSRFDALWASPGSPYKSMGGVLHAIRFARERLRPMVAT